MLLIVYKIIGAVHTMELYQPISKIVNDGDTIGYMLLNLDESGNSFGIPVITEVSIDYFKVLCLAGRVRRVSLQDDEPVGFGGFDISALSSVERPRENFEQ